MKNIRNHRIYVYIKFQHNRIIFILSIYPRIRGNPRISRVRGKSSKTREDFFKSRKFLEFVAFSEIPFKSLGSRISGGFLEDFYCVSLINLSGKSTQCRRLINDTIFCDSSLQNKIYLTKSISNRRLFDCEQWLT